jgi:hypothetical protein
MVTLPVNIRIVETDFDVAARRLARGDAVRARHAVDRAPEATSSALFSPKSARIGADFASTGQF